MKVLTLVAVMSVIAGGQPASSSVSGTWIAQLEGQAYVRLVLSSTGGVIRGFIALGDVEFDRDGTVLKVGVPPRNMKAISDVKQREAIMTFSVAGSDEPDNFEFKLIDPTHGELRLIISDELRQELVADNLPLPGPIPMTKR